jgi:hypothetical protein
VTKMKRVFFVLILSALTLSVLDFAQVKTKAHPSSLDPQSQSGSRATPSAAAVRFLPRAIKEQSKKLRYTITARYPEAAGAARNASLASLNQQVKELIQKEVAAFKKDFEPPDEVMSEMGSYYDASYEVELASNNLVSIYFGVSTYGEGAAHPNHNSLVFNYDLSAGRTLNLSDLFKPNSNYLDVISRYSINALKKKLGPDPDMEWIQKGAGAEAANYQNWNLKRTGLTVMFDPYQVASYAEGQHEVLIPYSVLKGVIDPQGPLARLAK